MYTIRDAAKPPEEMTAFRTFRHHAPITIRLLLVPLLVKEHFSLAILLCHNGEVVAYHINPSSGAAKQPAYGTLADHLVPIMNTI